MNEKKIASEVRDEIRRLERDAGLVYEPVNVTVHVRKQPRLDLSNEHHRNMMSSVLFLLGMAIIAGFILGLIMVCKNPVPPSVILKQDAQSAQKYLAYEHGCEQQKSESYSDCMRYAP